MNAPLHSSLSRVCGAANDPLVLDGIIFGLQRMGGISNQWTYLVEALNQLDGGNRPQLLLPRNVQSTSRPEFTGLEIRAQKIPNRIARYLPVFGVDSDSIFHTSYYRVPAKGVRRYLASVYDFTYERYASGLAREVHHSQKKSSILSADMAVCISESTRCDLLNYFPTVDPSRTAVVPLGVDRSRFYPDAGHYSGRPFALFVGSRVPYKRFDLLVDALAITPGLDLRVVGPPLQPAEIAELNRRVQGRWIEHASVGVGELRRLYSDAFAFVFPSDYEGFGLPILEAMACRCPVIAADRSSFPEVAGGAALYAERQEPAAYADKLEQLKGSQLRERVVNDGEERVAAFDWDDTAKLTFDLYC